MLIVGDRLGRYERSFSESSAVGFYNGRESAAHYDITICMPFSDLFHYPGNCCE